MNKTGNDDWVRALSLTHDADIMTLFLEFLEERRRRMLARRTCEPVQLPYGGRVSVKGIL